MIEVILINYLTEKMNIPVFAEEPDKPPSRYVIVENQGTSVDNHIYNSLVAIQVYSESLLECATLCTELCHIMDGIIELDEITKAKLNSRYPFNDIKTHRYRYQAVYDLVHY